MVKKFKNRRRKATKAVVSQGKVCEKNSVLVIDLEEKEGKLEENSL